MKRASGAGLDLRVWKQGRATIKDLESILLRKRSVDQIVPGLAVATIGGLRELGLDERLRQDALSQEHGVDSLQTKRAIFLCQSISDHTLSS